MLSDRTKQEIRDKLQLIKTAMPNCRDRAGQRRMVAEVAKTLGMCPDPVDTSKARVSPPPGTNIVCINAGTGLGKSLGYSLPATTLARAKRKRLVISSSTLALQEQLISDLPRFFRAAQITATIAIAKGRTRYVCNYRLLQAATDLSQTTMFGREERAKTTDSTKEDSARIVAAMIDAYQAGTWNGDRDDWAPSVDDTFWNSITTDRHGCLGQNCPSYRACSQIAARKRVSEAEIVVANHALVLSDLATGGKVIGKPEDCFYVFDEAHNLPDRAVATFATNHFVGAGRRLMEKVAGFAGSLAPALGPAHLGLAQDIGTLADRLGDNLNDAFQFFSSLAQLRPTEAIPRPTLEFELSCVPEEFHSIGDNVKSLAAEVTEKFKSAADILGSLLASNGSNHALYEKLLADIGFYQGGIEAIHDTWELFLEEPALELPPIAKWIEASKSRQVDYQLCASPVLAGGYLCRLLWDKVAGAVLTSATMTSLGSFKDFLRRSGLDRYGDAVVCIDLPSPFNYRDQATLEIPQLNVDPKSYEAHTREITERIRVYISEAGNEGTLVLFTSRRQMEDVAGRLPMAMRQIIQVQGAGSKATILREHKARIDEGRTAAIFGLMSFSEGVDLADRYCTHVIIAKLAFAVPDDPVLRTLSDWIKRRGGNPFMEIAVPDAARKLEQSVGRLIRTEADRGRVTVLDPRLWNSRFGQAMLRGLPPFRLIAKGREVSL